MEQKKHNCVGINFAKGVLKAHNIRPQITDTAKIFLLLRVSENTRKCASFMHNDRVDQRVGKLNFPENA